MMDICAKEQYITSYGVKENHGEDTVLATCSGELPRPCQAHNQT